MDERVDEWIKKEDKIKLFAFVLYPLPSFWGDKIWEDVARIEETRS
jgi:hypothetical protein